MCRSDLLKLPILCYMYVFKGSQTTDCNFHLWVTAAWKHISDWMAGNESRINALAQRVPGSEEEENNVVDVLSACDEYFKCSINTNTMIHKEFWLNLSCGWCPPTLSLLFFYFYLLIHFFYLFILSVFNRTKLLSWRNPHPFFPSLPPSVSPPGSWSTEPHSSPTNPSSRFMTTSSPRSRRAAAAARCSWGCAAGKRGREMHWGKRSVGGGQRGVWGK